MRFIQGKIHGIREKTRRDPHPLHQRDVVLFVAKLVGSPLLNVFSAERSQHEALASNLGDFCLAFEVNSAPSRQGKVGAWHRFKT